MHANLREPAVRRARLLAAWALLCAVLAAPARPASEGAKEHQVKAAFLWNFAKYTTWPDTAFAREESPFVVAVLGKDPFGELLDQTLADKKVGTHPVRVERHSGAAAIGRPHLLFVAETDPKVVEPLLRALREEPVLVVGEADGFVARGGTIGFYLEKQNVRFEVRPATARRAGLKIAAQLLKLARIVEE